MSKTYLNRQLPSDAKIKDTYTYINSNSSEVDADLTELYDSVAIETSDRIASDNALDVKLEQIITETALDPNKDPEVTNARGTFDTVGLRLDDSDSRVTTLESEVNTPDTGTATLDSSNLSVTKTDSVSIDGVISQLAKFGGATLYNAITNGDFSDGITNYTDVGSTLSVLSNVMKVTGDGTDAQTILIGSYPAKLPSLTDDIYHYAMVRVTNSSCSKIEFILDGTTAGTAKVVKTISNPIINTWYELGSIDTYPSDATGNIKILILAQYPDATTANGKVMEVDGNAGVFSIPLTDTPYENHTADQMNAVVSEPFEGLKPTTKATVESRGVNLLDESKVTWGKTLSSSDVIASNSSAGYSDFISVDELTTYHVSSNIGSGGGGVNYYNKNKNLIGSKVSIPSTGGDFTTIANTKFIRTNVFITGKGTLSLSKGSGLLTPYEDYNGSTLKINCTDESLFAFSQVPNLTENSLDLVNGGLIANKKIRRNSDVVVVGVTNGVNVTRAYALFSDASSWSTDEKLKINPDRPLTLSSSYDAVSEIGKMYVSSSLYAYYILPLGTTIGDAQTLLNNAVLEYQLATPIIIPQSDFPSYGIELEGSLKTSDGTTEFIAYDYDLLPSSIEIDYARNISQAVSNVSDAVIELEKEVDIKANKVQEDWIKPTLLNGWTNVVGREVGYYKDDFGIVHLKGNITGGTTTIGTALFTFANGYKPSLQPRLFVGMKSTPTAIIQLIVSNVTGNASLGDTGGTNIFLDGISFRAEG